MRATKNEKRDIAFYQSVKRDIYRDGKFVSTISDLEQI